MNIGRETVYAAFWAAVSAATVNVLSEPQTVPATPGPYVLTTKKQWVSDIGVAYAAGGALVKVPSSPTVGQYSVASGVYTFNSGDNAVAMLLSYVTPAFPTSSRRLRHWDDVPPSEQPALFMVENLENVKQVKGIPPTWTFHPHLFVYDNVQSDPDAIPGQRLNILLDAIDNALAPVGGSGGYQTLGGLVSHCWISGPIDIYEGYKAMLDQSVAIVPIEIKIPDSSGPV
jgi:hypothetical protein